MISMSTNSVMFRSENSNIPWNYQWKKTTDQKKMCIIYTTTYRPRLETQNFKNRISSLHTFFTKALNAILCPIFTRHDWTVQYGHLCSWRVIRWPVTPEISIFTDMPMNCNYRLLSRIGVKPFNNSKRTVTVVCCT